MGILKVGAGAVSSVLADQWREYFYCPSLEEDVLVTKGVKRSSKISFNTKGSDNLITNGSIIAVNEGQCMMIVDQGAIVEVCAEAGEFVYDSSTEPSIFYGSLKDSIVGTFKQFAKRVTLGGDTGKDQRIYYFNTKEILGNKYGTANPVPFRVVDQNIGLDIDISIRCHGEYAYRIMDPILFYKNICGNIEADYTRDQIDSQLKSEMLTALQPAFGKISAMGIRYSALPGHTMELANALNEVLAENWAKRYGIEISSIGVNSVKAPEEDEKMIKELQRNAVFRNPGMAAAHLTSAQADAMKAAASNTSTGPMMAFAGMNMAAGAGGINAGQLFQMAGNQQMANPQPAAPVAPAQAANGWNCSCGQTANEGKFCTNCGKPKPVAGGFWTCSCGTQNKGKFCMECGTKKPADALLYKCDKCGWEPEDPKKPPKFCPQCGDPFTDADIK
ncbi:MAG: SPFH domain-containing protein [Lachnospiraceae bacterium]|nr:SPFH domain-containing protein [Lachnospiraceae bacterium]